MKGFHLVKLRQEPERRNAMARWFHEKWGISSEAYEESMAQCLEGKAAVLQWYLLMEGETVMAGAGVIENDFHDRPNCGPISALSMWNRPTGRRGWLAPFWMQSGLTWGNWGRRGFTWSPITKAFMRAVAGSFWPW